jgi:signal transduction histidine kinase
VSDQPTGQRRAERAAWVSLLSHESRTPLATVIAATRELCDHWASLAPVQRSALLEIIAQESERLVVLVGGELGQAHTVALAPCDVGAIAATTVRAAGLAYPQVVLSLDLPPSVPRVQADAFAVRQVLTNLIDNAVEHGGDGAVELGVVVEAERVGVAVRDRGVGIAPGEQRLIFERGARAAGATPRTGGLGLWISRSIAQAHGGTLELQSTPGRGATFTFWLPRGADSHSASG